VELQGLGSLGNSGLRTLVSVAGKPSIQTNPGCMRSVITTRTVHTNCQHARSRSVTRFAAGSVHVCLRPTRLSCDALQFGGATNTDFAKECENGRGAARHPLQRHELDLSAERKCWRDTPVVASTRCVAWSLQCPTIHPARRPRLLGVSALVQQLSLRQVPPPPSFPFQSDPSPSLALTRFHEPIGISPTRRNYSPAGLFLFRALPEQMFQPHPCSWPSLNGREPMLYSSNYHTSVAGILVVAMFSVALFPRLRYR
jgi:hypothetical protein